MTDAIIRLKGKVVYGELEGDFIKVEFVKVDEMEAKL